MRIGKWKKTSWGWGISEGKGYKAYIDLIHFLAIRKWRITVVGKNRKRKGKWINPQMIIKNFNTKSEAIKYAVNYMKKHPNG